MSLCGWIIDLVWESNRGVRKGTSRVQLSHKFAAVSAVFDDESGVGGTIGASAGVG